MATRDLKSLVSQLTLEEKVKLLAGKDFWVIDGVPRLGIPPIKFSDGPNGARGGVFEGGVKAACFPAGVCLAAAWDLDLAGKIGKALAEETKTKGASVILGPTVCPHRDPRGGRNFESFSEDPLLAGEIAAAYIAGVQSQGIAATIKHFAVNESETHRLTMDAQLSQRAMREIYLKPFEIAIKKSEPWALMTGYNLVNGIHCDMNKQLVTDILRKQWGYTGLVMSDWGGCNSTVESLNAGLNLEMPGPTIYRKEIRVAAALKEGSVKEETIDDLIMGHLNLLQRTKRFENPEIPEEQAIDLPEHRQLIRQAGAAGAVLLKNENNILPLKTEKLKSIALVGLAKAFLGHGGGSAAVNSHRKTTPFDALQEVIGDKVELRYAEGVHLLRNLPALKDDCVDDNGQPGFTVKMYDAVGKSAPDHVANMKSAHYSSLTARPAKAVTFSGTFTPSVSGKHYVSFASVGNTRVSIDDKVLFEVKDSSADVMGFLLGVAAEEQKQYSFEAGQKYKILVEATESKDEKMSESLFAGSVLGFNFGFVPEAVFEEDILTAAVEAARSSDLAIVFTGHTTVWETEGTDRTKMDLPKDGSQDELVEAVLKVNPNTIVVNSTGSPITMPWLDKVQALVQTWLPGQEHGYTIADILLGQVNPSGRLPVTFPKNEKVCPAYENFPGDTEKDIVQYKEGIYVGYRHYDTHPDDVIFPFGYGLSYTTFSVSDVAVSERTLSPSSKITVSAKVKNTGSISGIETVQVYVGPSSSSSVDRPKKELAGFAKAGLSAGGSTSVSVEVGRDAFARWSEEEDQWVVDAGEYTVSIGTSSVDIKGTATVKVEKSFTYEP